MSKAQRSGLTVRKTDVPIILGMIVRGDRKHDIAAWFGLNQGRIKDTEDGKYGLPNPAPASQLPPSGPPGLKGRALRAAVEKARKLLPVDPTAAVNALMEAISDYDKSES
jgi:hypothetical protein